MHIGVTEGRTARGRSRVSPTDRPRARSSADGRVVGTYIHGLFADDRQRAAWLEAARRRPSAVAYEASIERTLDALAAHLAAHLDLDRLLTLAR